MRVLIGLTFLVGCSQGVGLDWKYDIQAGSVSTPLVTANFIAFGHERGLTVLEPNGRLRCTFEANGEVIGKPASDGQRIFLGSTNYLAYAVDASCKQLWKFPTRDRIKSDPMFADGRVYFSSYDGHLYALDAEHGTVTWMFPPAKADAAVMASLQTLVAPEKDDKPKAKSAKKEPEPPPPPPPATAAPAPIVVGDFSYSSPVLADGVVYLGNLDQHLYAIDAATGAMRWRFKTDGAVTSTPLVASGVVYFGSNDGNLYAVDVSTTQVKWRFTTHDWVNSSPRLDGGLIYVGSNDRHLYAIDAASGAEKWRFEANGPVITIPAVFKNLVFVAGASGDGAIYAVDNGGGALFWQYQTGGKIESDPVIVGDTMYVTSTDHFLYAFKISATTKS